MFFFVIKQSEAYKHFKGFQVYKTIIVSPFYPDDEITLFTDVKMDVGQRCNAHLTQMNGVLHIDLIPIESEKED